MSVTMRIIVEFLLLVIFLTCVFCKETDLKVKSNLTELTETGRRHHGYGLYKWWGGIPGLYALGVLYWLKVKAVIVAFIVGTAIVWGFKWYKGGHCGHDIIHESPIISYDHGPAWSSGPHDHIPYSLDHNPFEHDHGHSLHEHEHFTSSDIVSDSLPDNGPYSSYAGAYSDVPPTAPTSDGTVHARHKRQLDTEQQVSDIVFAFLGITNDGCRRRFICEMEFRSKANPFTRIAFGIVGRGLFSKYVNRRNVNGRAGSFRQCADVNPDCVLMEENIHDDEENEVSNQEGEYESRSLKSSSISDIEKENSTNLKAEKESFKQNLKTDPIVQGIFSRMQPTY